MTSVTDAYARVPISLPAVVVFAALLAGCGGGKPENAATSSGKDSGPVVEVVNGQPISQAMLDVFLKGRRNLDPSNPAMRDRALRQLADFVLIDQAAKKSGLADSPDFKVAAELGRMQGIWRAAMEKFADPAQIDDSAVRAEYDRQYKTNGTREYTFGQMTFTTKEAAAKVAAELSGKKTFEQLMEAHKKDADVRIARNFRSVQSNRLPVEIAKVLAPLKAGDTLKEPLQVPQGWAILHVTSVDAITPPPYDQVKDNIRRVLARRQAEKHLTDLRDAAKITQNVVAPSAAANGKPGLAPQRVPARPPPPVQAVPGKPPSAQP